MTARDCDAHRDVSAEARALAEQLAEALEPWAQGLREAADEGASTEPITCRWCPVCAVMGLLRGDRPELAARLAEHGVGLLAAIRELLADPPTDRGSSGPASSGPASSSPGSPAPGDAAATAGGGRRAGVQRIPVRRVGDRDPPGADGDSGC